MAIAESHHYALHGQAKSFYGVMITGGALTAGALLLHWQLASWIPPVVVLYTLVAATMLNSHLRIQGNQLHCVTAWRRQTVVLTDVDFILLKVTRVPRRLTGFFRRCLAGGEITVQLWINDREGRAYRIPLFLFEQWDQIVKTLSHLSGRPVVVENQNSDHYRP